MTAGIKTTPELFLEQVSGRPFDVIGTYVNSATRIRLKCKVDGHEWEPFPHNLLSGKGCPICGIRKSASARRKSNTVLEDHGEWLLVDISTPTHPSASMKIGKADFTNSPKRIFMCTNGYAHMNLNRNVTALHRFLNPTWKYTDHINRDRTDNRRSNLRECTNQQNSMNAGICVNNRSGVTGITFRPKSQRWIARIWHNGKTIHIGSFINKQDAANARREHELLVFGKFAPTQPPETQQSESCGQLVMAGI